MKQETYKSTTMGEIPLSFTGRHLLQSLREATTDLQAAAANGKPVNYQAVSMARGRIAQYMSDLERKNERPRAFWRDPEPLEVAAKRQEAEDPANFRTFNCRCIATPANPFEVVGTVAATIEASGKDESGAYHLHLPPIPPGYAFHSVGNMMTIEPHETKPKNEEMPNKLPRLYANNLADAMNEYRDALTAAQIPGAMRDWQERVDKARMAVFDLFHKVTS